MDGLSMPMGTCIMSLSFLLVRSDKFVFLSLNRAVSGWTVHSFTIFNHSFMLLERSVGFGGLCVPCLRACYLRTVRQGKAVHVRRRTDRPESQVKRSRHEDLFVTPDVWRAPGCPIIYRDVVATRWIVCWEHPKAKMVLP